MKRHQILATVCASVLALGSSLQLSATSPHQNNPKAQASAKSAQTGTVDTHGQKARGSADNDPNVKTKAATNDPSKKMPAPAHKGGPKDRAGACVVMFDNYTPWAIEAFVDGDYWGVVPRYGELTAYVGNGRTQVYARARFTDGSMLTFGPQYFGCNNERLVWKLHP
jgi:hypothetical protein